MSADKSHVRSMFSRIAPSYDLLNRLMTFWQDIRWRRILIREIPLPDNAMVLDIGCGTGDLAREARYQHPDCRVIAADFTPEMVQIGSQNTDDDQIDWIIADAEQLPFAEESFQAVVSGFLLRNVTDVSRSLKEQSRVSKEDGWTASLDTTPPDRNWLKPFTTLYLDKIVPALGSIVGGDATAYHYLSESTREFLDADQIKTRFVQAEFREVKYQKFMFRTIAIHWGSKSSLTQV